MTFYDLLSDAIKDKRLAEHRAPVRKLLKQPTRWLLGRSRQVDAIDLIQAHVLQRLAIFRPAAVAAATHPIGVVDWDKLMDNFLKLMEWLIKNLPAILAIILPLFI